MEQQLEIKGILIEGTKSLDELFQGTFLTELYLCEGTIDPMVKLKEGEKIIGKMVELERRLYELAMMKKAQVQFAAGEGIICKDKEKAKKKIEKV